MPQMSHVCRLCLHLWNSIEVDPFCEACGSGNVTTQPTEGDLYGNDEKTWQRREDDDLEDAEDFPDHEEEDDDFPDDW